MNMATKAETPATATASDPRWAAVVRRDPAGDGKFVYSVSTTGVYCRPSCSARRPRPEHVAFHASAADAERAGFRACKRCKPGAAGRADRHAELVVNLCRLLERSDTPPSLTALSDHAGISPFHLHRVFKRITGLTPNAYARAHRAKRFRAELAQAPTVTEAIYNAGYGSNGRCYEESNRILGMTPSEFRAGANDLPIRFALGECSLGVILVAETARGVCAILLGDDPDELQSDLRQRFPGASIVPAQRGFRRTLARVVALVEAPARGHDLPLDIRGTAFQQRVWQALQRIPAGTTLSYAELARRVGEPRAVRAVAQACAANALAVAVPCHRAVRSDGGLSGYHWGLKRKQALLKREAQR